ADTGMPTHIRQYGYLWWLVRRPDTRRILVRSCSRRCRPHTKDTPRIEPPTPRQLGVTSLLGLDRRKSAMGLGRVKTLPQGVGWLQLSDLGLFDANRRHWHLRATVGVPGRAVGQRTTLRSPLRSDRCDERFDADDVHHPRQIVGEHGESHLGGDLR